MNLKKSDDQNQFESDSDTLICLFFASFAATSGEGLNSS